MRPKTHKPKQKWLATEGKPTFFTWLWHSSLSKFRPKEALRTSPKLHCVADWPQNCHLFDCRLHVLAKELWWKYHSQFNSSQLFSLECDGRQIKWLKAPTTKLRNLWKIEAQGMNCNDSQGQEHIYAYHCKLKQCRGEGSSQLLSMCVRLLISRLISSTQILASALFIVPNSLLARPV